MKAGFTHEDRDSKNVDWYTPPWVFERMSIEFDLDPCQPETKIPWVPAKLHYHEAQDGLAQPWHGCVWCNPTYGAATAKWLKRMHEHRNGVSLVFARTDTSWFHDYAAKADAILFIRKRIKFVDGLCATAGSGAGAGSMLIAWGHQGVSALEKMQDIGLLVRFDCSLV